MKARIELSTRILKGKLESVTRNFVQIICNGLDERAMMDLYLFKASIQRLPSGKLSIIIDREDIVSINFIDED